jgi:hypothetical protein
MSYDIPAGDNIILDLISAAPSYAGDEIVLDLADDIPVPWYWLPSGMSPGVQIPWGTSKRPDADCRVRWADMPGKNAVVRSRHGSASPVEHKITILWNQLQALSLSNRAAWEGLLRSDAELAALWADVPARDTMDTIPWGEFSAIDDAVTVPYTSPPAKEGAVDLAYGEFEVEDTAISVPWSNPPAKDRDLETMWGREYYQRICYRRYEPPAGDNILLDLDEPLSEVGDGDHINFYIDSYTYDERCSQREPSGWRDAYIYIPPKKYPRTPKQKVYVVMNSAMLKRVSDNHPIEAISMGVRTDLQSWCWGFSGTILKRSAFNLIAPDLVGNTEVEVEINGHRWRIMIEGAEESRTFGHESWNISGRSLSAMLADPYAPKTSYVESQERTAIQLIEDRLENTGWTLDWQAVDWSILANAYSYMDLTPLEAIQKVVAAGRAWILSDPVAKVLHVYPRYPRSPWTWATATPDLAITGGLRGSGHRWRPGAVYDAVFVSGRSQGVIAKVIRTGSAGLQVAPMVTDDLITDTDVARECGRNILAASGNWSEGSYPMRLMPDPNLPGLVLPGRLVEMTDYLVPWRGQVTGVAINAAWQRGLKITQTLEIERYHG